MPASDRERDACGPPIVTRLTVPVDAGGGSSQMFRGFTALDGAAVTDAFDRG
jgi:hypothetical protein